MSTQYLECRRPRIPEALIGNQRASLVGSMLDRRLRAANVEPVAGLDAPPPEPTAAGWTGKRSWKLGLRGEKRDGKQSIYFRFE